MRQISLIPYPKSCRETGERFTLSASARIVAATSGALPAAGLLAEYLRPATGFALPVVTGPAETGDIRLSEHGENETDDGGFVRESYLLTVSPGSVELDGANAPSLALAIQTLRQLFPPEIYADSRQDAAWELPGVEIADAPKYRWRGLMLDIARHFLGKHEICRMIELAAQHRFNRIHLHLTDDQGWRIEIKRYPRLTEIGSVRPRTVIGHESARPRRYDETPYGGFLSRQEIREIVAFAERRHITVMPEIDMPGHMQAALAAYPEFGHRPDWAPEPRDCWGISRTILAPLPATVEFMQNILAELLELFPSRFIHVGGDEALKEEWELDCRVQRRMAELGLRNEHEMQSHFLGEMDRFLQSRGRRMIGWDEILEGGLTPGAAVMSWRGSAGALAAARQGHDAVMASKEFAYLDYFQADPAHEPLGIGGDLPAEKVYRYTAEFPELTPEEQMHIIGGQGQLWSEYIPSLSHLEYMAFPRACALAEKLWREPGECRFADFRDRLAPHRRRFAVQSVNACPLP
ncbi:MAG: beta-N-acetylhexosaminidase [Lentisphaeria bacterium]|nr:beta-N-acetylhexosaminidase [Lentisphaeria bacterium]